MQKRTFFILSGLVAMSLLLLVTACQESENVSDVENYVSEAIYEMERNSRCGQGGCYEFVFPITVDFPDGTQVDAESYEDLRDLIRGWRQSNPEADERPRLGFPLEVTTAEGEIITVEDRIELRRLMSNCRRPMGPRRPGHHGAPCFRLVYPLTIALPDGAEVEVEGPRHMKTTVRRWRAENRGSTERPEFVFPIEVEAEDGTMLTVESKEALIELKESCSDS